VLEEIPMAMVGGLDLHRKQITFDVLDTDTGEVRRGRISPADRQLFRGWLAGLGGGQVELAVEGWVCRSQKVPNDQSAIEQLKARAGAMAEEVRVGDRPDQLGRRAHVGGAAHDQPAGRLRVPDPDAVGLAGAAGVAQHLLDHGARGARVAVMADRAVAAAATQTLALPGEATTAVMVAGMARHLLELNRQITSTTKLISERLLAAQPRT
jgi:hypothetical protein